MTFKEEFTPIEEDPAYGDEQMGDICDTMKVKSTIRDYDGENKITVKSSRFGYGNVEVSINNSDAITVKGKQLIKAIENAMNN